MTGKWHNLTYQIYEKHFVWYEEYRNKDGDKPSNSERTLQIAKEIVSLSDIYD